MRKVLIVADNVFKRLAFPMKNTVKVSNIGPIDEVGFQVAPVKEPLRLQEFLVVMNVKKSKGVMGYILVELRKSEMQPGRRIVGGNRFP